MFFYIYIYYTLMFTKTKQMQKELSIILALDFSSYTFKNSKTGTVSLLQSTYYLLNFRPKKKNQTKDSVIFVSVPWIFHHIIYYIFTIPKKVGIFIIFSSNKYSFEK